MAISSPSFTTLPVPILISSKGMTEFDEFPMKDGVADFPHHSKIKDYFKVSK